MCVRFVNVLIYYNVNSTDIECYLYLTIVISLTKIIFSTGRNIDALKVVLQNAPVLCKNQQVKVGATLWKKLEFA